MIGAGLAGLVAGYDLQRLGFDVTVFESSPRPGGELARTNIAGVSVDVGAEAFLVTRPEAAELAAELGLELVSPTAAAPAVLIRGELVALPTGTLMGIPRDLAAVAGFLGPVGTARAALDLVLPPGPDADVGIATLVRRRLGARVSDQLVEPLLAGVYAGDANRLSVRATVPVLGATRGSLIRAARKARSAAGGPHVGPVFAAPRTGVAGLAEELARRVDVHTRTTVTRIGPKRHLTTSAGEYRADAVVLATRGPAAVRLLRPLIGPIEPVAPYASVAVVTLAFARSGAGRLADPTLSGWLVPPREARRTGQVHKGVTLTSNKWAHVAAQAPDAVVVRASVGRFAEEGPLQSSDRELAGIVAAEVSAVAGGHSRLLGAKVTRWGGALPQYLVGHVGRVQALRAALPEGIAVCGATYDGIGVPAVIASAHTAAGQVAAFLGG